MKPPTHLRPDHLIAAYATEVAQRSWRKPSDVMQEFLRRGAFEHQLQEFKRRRGE